MIYVSLPEKARTQNRRLGFYLAMEEYLALHRDERELFFMWQTDPTVICGRNQEVEKETDLEYCDHEGIEIVRRKSGGGCVFSDRSNIMFSYISHSADVRTTFDDYTARVAAMLCDLGLDATDNARNDILISGRKVSGCAFYHLPGRSIVHGTMLYDTDGRHISKALTPSKAKLQSKGVKSVESRITTIRHHLPDLSIHDFMAHAARYLCEDNEITLTLDDVRRIEEMEKEYYRPEWTFRTLRHSGLKKSARVEGVGEVGISLTTDRDGKIQTLNLSGDFFSMPDSEMKLQQLLQGTAVNREELIGKLADEEISKLIIGLDNDKFVELLTLAD